ncbi:hypothetical protein D5S18_13915 [Nocardia panacis]|uniref:Uncharacterized protein n=2 Tax=Nocardia panacis TaxID=2340916 RepID=A0A3A4K931_9NOCA|nr:hypothetical protein D5S18_13915 [Nocardia panacis]
MYWSTMQTLHKNAQDLIGVGQNELSGWRGMGAESANQAIDAVYKEISVAQYGYEVGYKTLETYLIQLKLAKNMHKEARPDLEKAAQLVSGLKSYSSLREAIDQKDYMPAVNATKKGYEALIQAEKTAVEAAEAARDTFNSSTHNSRAHWAKGSRMDALTVATMAYTDPNLLSDAELEKASINYDKLTDERRKQFEESVANAKSPKDAAKLWKKLSNDEVEGDGKVAVNDWLVIG